MIQLALQEVQDSGKSNFVAEHKKRPMISYLIQKSDEIYEQHDNTKAVLDH